MMPVVEQLMANHIGIIEHDTLPGIVARMTPENAKVMNAIKGRPPSKGFIVLIPNVDWVSPLATSVSEQAKALMAKHWPGPLTIILNKHPNVPDAITGGRQTIALRYPKHALLTSVLTELNEPLLSTSANMSTHTGITPALLNAVQFTHGDIHGEGLASTIVDATSSEVTVIRQGAIFFN